MKFIKLARPIDNTDPLLEFYEYLSTNSRSLFKQALWTVWSNYHIIYVGYMNLRNLIDDMHVCTYVVSTWNLLFDRNSANTANKNWRRKLNYSLSWLNPFLTIIIVIVNMEHGHSWDEHESNHIFSKSCLKQHIRFHSCSYECCSSSWAYTYTYLYFCIYFK